MMPHLLNRRKFILHQQLKKLTGLTVLVLDEFTDADATALEDHTVAPTNTPSASWTALVAGVLINGNKAYGSGTPSSLKESDLDVGVADCIIEADVASGAGLDVYFYGLLSFRVTDSNNRWSAGLVKETGSMTISERTSSVTTIRAEDTSYTWADNESFHFKLTLLGNDITFECSGDHVCSLSYSSAVRATVTLHGIRSLTPAPPASTANLTFDNYKVSI